MTTTSNTPTLPPQRPVQPREVGERVETPYATPFDYDALVQLNLGIVPQDQETLF